MKHFFALTLAILLGIFSSASAQKVMKKLMIVEGNNFGAPNNLVKLAAYYPELGQLNYRDSLLGDFTNDIAIDGDIAYVHIGNADASKDRVYKFNINCHQKLDSVNIPGLQRMKIYNSKLIVSRGFGSDTNFIEIYDKNSLARISTFPEADLYCSDFTILGNRAYVAMTGSWPVYTDSGTIAVVDLNTNTFVGKIKLDTFAKVANQVFAKGNKLYIISSNTYVTVYDLSADTFVNYANGYLGNPYGIYNDKIYMDLGASRGYFDLTTNSFDTIGVYQGQYQYGYYDTLTSRGFFLFQNFSPFESGVYSVNAFSNSVKDSMVTGAFSVGALFYSVNASTPNIPNKTIYLPVNKDTVISYSGFASDCDHHAWTLVSGPRRIGATVDSLGLGRYKYTPAASLVARDTFSLRVCDEGGSCSISNVFIESYDPLFIKSLTLNKINVFPNPFSSELVIENLPEDVKNISVFDIHGKLLFEFLEPSTSHKLDLSNSSDGMYLIRIIGFTESTTLRIIKQ